MAKFDRLSPGLESRIRQAVKQSNQVVREHLRSEMGVRLAGAEESQAVPVRVVMGLPSPLWQIVENIDESELPLLLNMPLISETGRGLDFLIEHGPQRDEPILSPARDAVKDLLERLKRADFERKMKAIHEDVLGAYFFNRSEVQIYWMAVGLVAAAAGISVEGLTVVVLIHELAHAYSHLGRDIDSNQWDTQSFATAELNIVEGIAQFYTAVVSEKIASRQPAASVAFDKLLTLQAEPYIVHRSWGIDARNGKPASRLGEIVRAALIETRTHGITNYAEFQNKLQEHRQRLAKIE